MLAIAIVGFTFSVYARLDWTGMARYFAPYVPVTFVLFWLGILAVHLRLARWFRGSRWLPRLCVMYTAMILAGGLYGGYRTLRPDSIKGYPGFVLTSTALRAPAEWMNTHLSDDVVIAARRIGALSYYSQRNIFDYKCGLTDRRVAQLISRSGRQFESPADPALASLWQSVAPDYILEDSSKIDRLISQVGGVREAFVVHDLLYRVKRSFPLGQGGEWVLCERVPRQDDTDL